MPWRRSGQSREPAAAVSVVMPTLNQQHFLAEAVASVMDQAVDGLELVVADGGSTDGTLELLAGLAAAHPGRLRWWSAPDDGPAAATNAAIARARGPVIGWLNSDDLYAPGAIARALDHLRREPGHVMVYGEAEHIDEQGRRIAAYPTRLPSVPLSEWADGCHICQPTVFFRREAFDAVGGLDTTLRAAFDFDLWLRLFKAYPGCVGHLPQVQAKSRLHAATITTRFRERVALEGLQVVHRHLGPAPAHWLLTHFAERLAQHPFEAQPADLRTELQALVRRATPWLQAQAPAELERSLAEHRALQLLRPGVFVAVHPDGWAPPELDLRVRQPGRPIGRLRLSCRHASPAGGPLDLEVVTPADGILSVAVKRPGRFEIDLPVPDQRPDARLLYRVHCRRPFVPALHEAGSTDRRALAFRIEDLQVLHRS